MKTHTQYCSNRRSSDNILLARNVQDHKLYGSWIKGNDMLLIGEYWDSFYTPSSFIDHNVIIIALILALSPFRYSMLDSMLSTMLADVLVTIRRC